MWENLKLRVKFTDLFVFVIWEKTAFTEFSHDLRATTSALGSQLTGEWDLDQVG